MVQKALSLLKNQQNLIKFLILKPNTIFSKILSFLCLTFHGINQIPVLRPSSNSFFDCHNPIGIKYIARIRITHLREHQFKHSFQDTLNSISNWGNDVEYAIHFFLHSPLYSNERRTLLNSLVNINYTLLDNTDFSLTRILLFGNTTFKAIENTKIINLTADFVLSTKRFDEFFFSVFSL